MSGECQIERFYRTISIELQAPRLLKTDVATIDGWQIADEVHGAADEVPKGSVEMAEVPESGRANGC